MSFLYLLAGAVVVFFTIITLIVLGQEVSALLSAAIFLGLLYGAWKLFQAKVTRL